MSIKGAEAPPTLRDSAQAFGRRLWHWGWAVVIGGVGGALGLVDALASATAGTHAAVVDGRTESVPNAAFSVPAWAWVTLLIGGLGFAVLMAFHDERKSNHLLTVGLVKAHEQERQGTMSRHAEALAEDERRIAGVRQLLEGEQRRRERVEAQLEALDAKPISESHLAQIRRIAESVAESIAARRECVYRDEQSALIDPRFREALTVHSPEVVAECDRWDEAVISVQSCEGLLERRVGETVDASFAPPWNPESLKMVVYDHVRRSAELPSDLAVQLKLNRGFSGAEEYIYAGPFAVYYQPGLTDENIEAAQQALNEVVTVLERWPVVDYLRDAYSERNRLMDPTRIAVLRIHDQHSLPRHGGCPLC